MDMTELTCNFERYGYTADGRIELIFCPIRDETLRARQVIAELSKVSENGLQVPKTPYSLKISKWRSKRSLNANAYMWVLTDKIASKLRTTKDEVYRKYIREVGVFRDLSINDEAVDTFIKAWGMHGTGWIAEKLDYGEIDGYSTIRAYYGSSVYSTKQMTRLIDMVVEDAVSLGIEVRTPDEIAEMLSLWGTDNAK